MKWKRNRERQDLTRIEKRDCSYRSLTIKSLLPYKQAPDELSVNHAPGIVLKVGRILMPKVSWKNSVSVVLEGCQGLAKTKTISREEGMFSFC